MLGEKGRCEREGKQETGGKSEGRYKRGKRRGRRREYGRKGENAREERKGRAIVREAKEWRGKGGEMGTDTRGGRKKGKNGR